MSGRVSFVLVLISSLVAFGCGISGTITEDGLGVEGITVILSGSANQTTTTDSEGNYSFDSLMLGPYTVTPDSCYAVDPEDQEIAPRDLWTDISSHVDFSIESMTWEGDHAINTLEDLEDLSGYTSVNGNLIITDTLLTSLDGLECLTEISGHLMIDSNEFLTSVEGLRGLMSTEGLLIVYNSALASLEGLNNLTSIGDTGLFISQTSLANLDELGSLSTIGGLLFIVFNDALESVEMPNLCRINNSAMATPNGFTVVENPSLCAQAAKALSDQVEACDGISGVIVINHNKMCP